LEKNIEVGGMRQMKKLKVKRDNSAINRMQICGLRQGNEQKSKKFKGCGARGMIPSVAGWKCLYCGFFRYFPHVDDERLWSHFKWAREYWKAYYFNGNYYINGCPVSFGIDPIPPFLYDDLMEVETPIWFRAFANLDEDDFDQYLSLYTRSSYFVDLKEENEEDHL
jgi:hypothetical protein